MLTINLILFIIILIIVAFAGAALGIWLTTRQTRKQLMENPPLTEDAMRMLMSNMGRKPSEAQVQQAMRQIRGSAKAAAKKK